MKKMNSKVILTAVLILLIIAFGLISLYNSQKINEKKECYRDGDCTRAGCSGELCIEKEKAIDIVTTCIWQERYECFKYTSCKCIKNKCSWQDTANYKKCLIEKEEISGI